MNLYERFGCNDKEELYDKLLKRDPEVHELLEFVEYAKCNLKSKETAIRSPQDFAAYYSKALNHESYDADEFTCVFVNTKNKPIHHSLVGIDNLGEVRSALKEGLSKGAAGVFIVRDEGMGLSKKMEINNLFKDIRLDILDEMELNVTNDKLYSVRGDYHYQVFPSSGQESQRVNEIEREDFFKYPEYGEFSKHYATTKIMDRDVIHDRHLIMENLKLGYQHEVQEYFGMVAYDYENRVISVDELFKGGVNSSIVDHRLVLSKVLENDEIKGVSIYHNHPSGVCDPSPEDIEITKMLQKVCERVDVELLDHYILAKESVYSFEKQDPIFETSNYAYQRAIETDKHFKRREGSILER